MANYMHFEQRIKKNIAKYLPVYKNFLTGCRKILDIGCGNGMQARIIEENIKGIKISCIDINYHLWLSNRDLPFTLFDGNRIPFKDGSFDVSLLFFTLHHAGCHIQLLREAKRVSNKILIFEEVYTNFPQKILMILYDVIVNTIIFRSAISLPHFQTEVYWNKIFKELNFEKITVVKLPKKWFYPPDRIFFVLNK